MRVSEEMITMTCSSCSKSRITTALEWGHTTTSGKCFKMCCDCCAKAKKQYARTPESTQEDNLQQYFIRYWNDVEFRSSKNEMNKVRSRNNIVCPECKQSMVCGSFL
jgi:hypothetical protein